MKHLLTLSLFATCLLGCLVASSQAKQASNTETKAKIKTQNLKIKVKGDLSAVALPYPVSYSSQFIIGDPSYSKLVLDMWKDFDNNTLDRAAALLADTVAFRMANGMWMRGAKEVLDGSKTYRSTLASVESSIGAVMSVHSIDKSEDWVLVWGTTKETDKSGKSVTMPVHELWRFNKAGKVDQMLQYTYTEAK